MNNELIEWVERGSPTHLTVVFPTEGERHRTRFVLAAIVGLWVLEADPSRFWEVPLQLRNLIHQLVTCPNLTVSDELQQVLDSRLYNVTLSQLFADLWSARFEFCETGSCSEETLASLVGRSLSHDSPWVFQDVTLFWLALAKQNGLVQRVVASVALDPNEDGRAVLDHLYQFLLSAERWALLGSPVRFLIGVVQGSHIFDLISEHPLATKLQESLI